MASVYGFVRTIAKVGAKAPSLRDMVGWNRPPARPYSETQRHGLATLVEREIIPRLVVAHVEPHVESERHTPFAAISADHVAAFSPLALDCSADVLMDHVEVFLDHGFSVDTIYTDLLAPAARQLGTMWDEDLTDFVSVTMGLWRLQELIRELSARVPTRQAIGVARRALFSVLPGDQHSFGTVMIEDIFQRAGWQTDLVTECDRSKLMGLAAHNAYDLISLTATSHCESEWVAALVNGLRSVTRNPSVVVMVGGHAFGDDPERAMATGADGTAATATEALALAARLVEERAKSRELYA